MTLRLASAFRLSQPPAPNFSESVKLQLGLCESPVPTKTRTFVPGATQATDPRAAFVPPRPSSCRPGSPDGGAASGRPPSHASRRETGLRRGPWPGPGAPGGASPAVPPAGAAGSGETPITSPTTRDLGAGCTDALGELAARTRARDGGRSPNAAVRKRAPKNRVAPQARPRRAPWARGPGSGRRLASRPRRGPSGKRSARRCGRPRGPRETNGRNRNAQEEGAGGQGPGAGRVAGPTSSRALGQQLSPRRRLRPRVLRCHEPEGGGRSRESWGSDARRQRRPGHVPLARPISPGGRGDVREAARPMTAVPSHVAGRTPMGGARAT